MNGDDPQKTNATPPPPPTPEAPAPPSQWEFKTDAPIDTPTPATAMPSAPQQRVQWSASEFIAHQKTATWYLVLFCSALIAAGLVYLITRGDKITSGAIVVAAVFLAIMAARKPRVLDYEVSSSGITIGRHFYPYSNFKSFSVIHEGAFSSISLMPLKRFMPFVTMYYAPEEEDEILTVLGNYLPIEQGKRDILDHFLERIRF